MNKKLLEERERLLKVAEAARVAERRASGLTDNPLGDLRHVARTLRAALDALEGKKSGRPMIKSHAQMPAGNRTHALEEKK